MTTLIEGAKRRPKWQLARWSFGSGLVVGYLHNMIWHVVTTVIPFL